MRLLRILEWFKTVEPKRISEAKRIGGAALLGALVAGTYLLITPNWYQATLTVVPAGQAKGGLASQIGNALGGAVDLPFDSGNVDIERIAAIFESNSVTDAVIQKFDLMKRYRQRYLEYTRTRLWSLCSKRIDRRARLVALSCEDTDPKFVTALLEYFGEYGNEVFRRVSTSSATEEVRFLQRRVDEMRKEADEAAQRLREFEEQHKIVDLDSQSKAVVSALASLHGQRISKDLELSYLNTFSSREESTAVQLRQQLAVIDAKFHSMEQDPSTAPKREEPRPVLEGRAISARNDLFPTALAVPKLRFELEQLYRDRKIRETDLVLLMQRLEMAKVNEARDTSAFQILDRPVVPTSKSRPKRALVLMGGFFLGLLLGVAGIFGPRYLREQTTSADSE